MKENKLLPFKGEFLNNDGSHLRIYLLKRYFNISLTQDFCVKTFALQRIHV